MQSSFSYLGLLFLFLVACNTNRDITASSTTPPEVILPADDPEAFYEKTEHYIPMRDGVRLYVAVYTPKDASPDNTYPIMMQRTCYSAKPYGLDQFTTRWNRFAELANEKYIFVFQDVRGRWMSEGTFDNMRPYIPNKTDNSQIDESSDTYDTIDWLVKNVPHNNGRVGVWGISYPGFYSTCSLIDAHPALKAVSPQAPIGDFYFDDFHHNGAYTLSYWSVNNLFGVQKSTPSDTAWYKFPGILPDAYTFYLRNTPLYKLDKVEQGTHPDNFFWQQIKSHPDYDEFWQKRNIVQHLKNIKPAVMTVGGWFDAEDLYGPLMTYGNIEKWNPDTYNTIVMGPWSHGDWARRKGRQAVSNVFFGENINENYQREVEARFFKHWLKGPANGQTALPEAYMYDCGAKEWQEFASWPPENVEIKEFYLGPMGPLSSSPSPVEGDHTAFISDPAHPVPFRMNVNPLFIPRKYMADDQRQAGRRPDVLTFSSRPLQENFTLAGPIEAELFVSTTGTDADWVVKVIDVYPDDHPDYEETQDHVTMGGYQQLVRGEVFRGRYRNGFERGVPFVPNEVTKVSWKLQDVFHTFKPGHRIMIQIHSSWFPYVDMNPQTFVPNIFAAKEEDFQTQTHRLYQGGEQASRIRFSLLQE